MGDVLKVVFFVVFAGLLGRALELDLRKEPARRAHRTRVVQWAASRWVAWAYPGQRARYLWRPGHRADVLLPGAPPFTIACDVDPYNEERVSCGLDGAPSAPAPAAAPPHVTSVIVVPAVPR